MDLVVEHDLLIRISRLPTGTLWQSVHLSAAWTYVLINNSARLPSALEAAPFLSAHANRPIPLLSHGAREDGPFIPISLSLLAFAPSHDVALAVLVPLDPTS